MAAGAPEALEQAPRAHGYLEISYWMLENGRERRKVKELILKASPDATSRPLLRLTDPEQTQLKGDDAVYIGTEMEEGQPYLQAWWVRLESALKGNGVRANEYGTAGKSEIRR